MPPLTIDGLAHPTVVRQIQEVVRDTSRASSRLNTLVAQVQALPAPLSLAQISAALSATGSNPIVAIGLPGTVTPASTGSGGSYTPGSLIVAVTATTLGVILPSAPAGQVLQSAGAATVPKYSTATYPATTTINQLLYSSAANVVSGLAVNATATLKTLTQVSSGAPTWTQLASTDLSDTANIARLNAANVFTQTNDFLLITPLQISLAKAIAGNCITITAGLTPNAGNDTQHILVNGSTTTAASGTHAIISAIRINALTVISGGATVTNTASLYIAGPMTATVSGTNYGLWVAAGPIRFGNLAAGTVMSDANGLLSVGAGGASVPQAVTRKPYWAYLDDSNGTTTFIAFGPTVSITGTTTNVQDATTGRVRFTTSAGDLQVAVFRTTTLGTCGTFQHTPMAEFNFFTGSATTTCQIWVGFFDSTAPGTAPGTNTSGVLTRIHAAFRFAALADGSTWHASTGDGTTQNTADTTITINNSTQYLLKIRFISNVSVGFSINGSTETVVAVASSAGDATRMIVGAYITNNGGGFTRFFDIAALYGDFS